MPQRTGTPKITNLHLKLPCPVSDSVAGQTNLKKTTRTSFLSGAVWIAPVGVVFVVALNELSQTALRVANFEVAAVERLLQQLLMRSEAAFFAARNQQVFHSVFESVAGAV
ncbi:hypothetical protein JTE90_008488 [Oedothorax gibbosus]|uniref:ABC transmembrane type-1 domain-containing protein n=1 Tax=Oedothorax gibbosus TaxID=931172 RepID=A0AAV6V0Z4_9ARAC|nr:hypothetical protein JTE90_008488 [Oedothorax gibbosus]